VEKKEVGSNDSGCERGRVPPGKDGSAVAGQLGCPRCQGVTGKEG